MFQTLAENNLSVNPRKTELAFQEVEYLGFNISADGLRMSQKRVETIKNLKPPRNIKGLQRLLGLINWYRRYIPNYAKNTYHLRTLLKKDEPFVWTPKCDEELSYLKTCLMNPPILRPIDPSRPLVIVADGSSHGFGWVALQNDDKDEWHPVTFGAKATTKQQQMYPADELEAIALMFALKSMEPVAIHKEVIVMTDNSHLLHLGTWQPINARQKRMVAYLSQFRLRIRYIKGKSNLQADCLSRLFQDSSDEERKEFRPTYAQEKNDFILAVTRSADRASLKALGDADS